MTTVALVAAKDAAASIADTVGALGRLRGVEEVWVVDDGSSDDTATRAVAAGARVIRLEVNRGKGGALAAGLEVTPHAHRYLLADADLGPSATGLQPLLDAPGDALTVGVLPPAGGRGGFGWVQAVARRGIRRATGVTTAAPLSGQRVVDGAALRALVLAPRFGVEVGMSIDLARRGVAIREIPVTADHAHRGRSVGGFAHRARQGGDVAAALVTRLTTEAQRLVAVALAGLVVFGALSGLSYARRSPRGVALPRTSHVVLFAYEGLSLRDVDRADRPALRALIQRGAAGALTVRTSDHRSLGQRGGASQPSAPAAFATLGASARVRAGADMAATRSLARHDHADSLPGALGDALHAAGDRTAVVAADVGKCCPPVRHSDWAVADGAGAVDAVAAFGGPRANRTLPDALRAVGDVNVVLVDPVGDLDASLAQTVHAAPADAVVIVFAPTPPGAEWELTPVVIAGPGVRHGSIASATTRRPGIGGLVDLAPTVLALRGVTPPAAMTGVALRVAGTRPDFAAVERLQSDGAVRARFFLPASVGYTVVAIVFYLGFIAMMRTRPTRVARTWLRRLACVAAAFPLAMLVTGALQHWGHVGGESPAVLVAVTAALGLAASRWRGIGPVYVLAALCLAVIAVDVAATGPLHAASLLGYSLQTTGRYYGLPNASSAVFQSSLLLVAAAVAGWAPTRVTKTAAVVVLTVGTAFLAAPWLGDDVGGFLTLLVVTVGAAWALSGRRFSRGVVVGGVMGVVVVFAAVAVFEARSGGSHLSRVAHEAASNHGGLRTTLTRRVEANFGLLVEQWWGFGSIALAVVGLWLLAPARRFADYLPGRSGLRVMAVAVLVTSIVGFLVNDSGPVVNVLCVVVLAPAMALTATAGRRNPSLVAAAP